MDSGPRARTEPARRRYLRSACVGLWAPGHAGLGASYTASPIRPRGLPTDTEARAWLSTCITRVPQLRVANAARQYLGPGTTPVPPQARYNGATSALIKVQSGRPSSTPLALFGAFISAGGGAVVLLFAYVYVRASNTRARRAGTTPFQDR